MTDQRPGLSPAAKEYLTEIKEEIQGTIEQNAQGGSVIAYFVGGCALLASLSLGPMDLVRSSYNQLIGDTPVVKSRLVDYSLEGIHQENPAWDNPTVGKYLAKELNVKVGEDGKFNPLEASISDLWDASEDHSHSSWGLPGSLWQQFVWTDLD